MRPAMLVLFLLLSGCAYSHPAVVIPTGNPVTDILVASLVWEGANLLARPVAASLLADAGAVIPRNQKLEYSRRAPGLVYAGDWR